MKKFKKALKFIVFHRAWIYVFALMLVVNYINSTLVLTLKKNYVFSVMTQDDNKVLAIYRNMALINANQVQISNRLLTIEDKLNIKVKKRIDK